MGDEPLNRWRPRGNSLDSSIAFNSLINWWPAANLTGFDWYGAGIDFKWPSESWLRAQWASRHPVVGAQCHFSFGGPLDQRTSCSRLNKKQRVFKLFELDVPLYLCLLLSVYLQLITHQSFSEVGWAEQRQELFSNVRSRFIWHIQVISVSSCWLKSLFSRSDFIPQPDWMCHYNSVIWREQQKGSHQCQPEI